MQSQTANKLFFILIILFSTFTINSQSITESLGGVKSNFIISTNSAPMEVREQIVFDKNLPIHEFRPVKERFLQWASPQALAITKERGKFRKYTKIEFFSKEGKLLHSFEVKERLSYSFEVRVRSNTPELEIISIPQGQKPTALYLYSLNINESPLILLDMTHRINIERYWSSWDYEH